MENPNKPTHSGTSPESARNGLADAKATLRAYETGILRDTMEAEADRMEARIAKVEAAVAAMPLDELACVIESACQKLSEAAHESYEADCELSYRTEAEGCHRAARILRTLGNLGIAGPELLADKPDPLLVKLAQVEQAFDGFTQEDCEWDADGVADFVEQLREILKGGSR